MAKKPQYIIIVGDINESVARTVQEFNALEKQDYHFILLTNREPQSKEEIAARELFDHVITIEKANQATITEVLKPYQDSIVGVTCRSEKAIPFFKKVVPHLPYLRTPTSESLEWSTNKLLMRERFTAYAPEITPLFAEAKDSDEKTIKMIEKEVGYPLIIKPSGFAQSIFVTNVYHRDELIAGLEHIFRKMKQLNGSYGEKDYFVLVEQLMEGSMYSVDLYVDDKGKMYFCPLVHVKTGKEIGFDDYFGYQQMTPSVINENAQKDAREAARKAVEALGLKNTSAHVELFRTESGWKIIEVGPRLGGFRHEMYSYSFGISHAANDLRIRMGIKPVLSNEIIGHTATLKIFALKEGKIVSITGLKKAAALDSMVSFKQNKKTGEKAVFAKHGGKSVVNAMLFNKDRALLLADIRRMEQVLKINVS